jgi:outer membrane autotransporter protein
VHEKIRPYIGAAYDYEFDSKARATTHGQSIDSHSLRGDTWMGELGLQFKLSEARPVTLDLGVQGYTGMRTGLTGSVLLKIEF